MEGNPRHVAYLQVWSFEDIQPGSIVVTKSDVSEESASVRADHVAIVEQLTDAYDPTQQNPVGVSDRFIPAKTRGTIVLSGIVHVRYALESVTGRRTGQYFYLHDTHSGQKINVFQPIGTIVESNFPGNMIGSTYFPTVSIFLCPWLCAVNLPLHDIAGDPCISFQKLFLPSGYEKFKAKMKTILEDDAQYQKVEETVGMALYEAIAGNELQFLL